MCAQWLPFANQLSCRVIDWIRVHGSWIFVFLDQVKVRCVYISSPADFCCSVGRSWVNVKRGINRGETRSCFGVRLGLETYGGSTRFLNSVLWTVLHLNSDSYTDNTHAVVWWKKWVRVRVRVRRTSLVRLKSTEIHFFGCTSLTWPLCNELDVKNKFSIMSIVNSCAKLLSCNHWWEFVVSGLYQAAKKSKQMFDQPPSFSGVWITEKKWKIMKKKEKSSRYLKQLPPMKMWISPPLIWVH